MEDRTFVEPDVEKKDPHFEIVKKILTKKEYLPLLEEMIIENQKDFLLADKVSKFSKGLDSKELYEAFKPLIPRIAEFLGVEPEYDFNVAILDEALKLRLRLAGYVGLPVLTGLGSAGLLASLLKKTITRREFLAGVAIAGGALVSGATNRVASHFDELDNDKYNGRYIVPLNTALIRDEKKEVQIPILMHEYVHILQVRAESWYGITIVNEGHAIGVANHFASLLAKEAKSPAYLRKIKNTTMSHVTQTYFWSCYLNKVVPNFPPLNKSYYLDTHSLGTALFLLAERKLGVRVYKEAIKNNLCFLDELEKENVAKVL